MKDDSAIAFDLIEERKPSHARAREPLAEYLAECRSLTLCEIQRWMNGRKHGKALRDLILEYPLRSAKGLRPALCIATCRALGGTLEGVLPSAAVLELYHNAFLIHDDVEDGSEKRRDTPTLHSQHGVPIAVNVGDAMLALAMSPLLDNTRVVGLGKALRILQVVSRMSQESAEGQAVELAWVRSGSFDQSDADYIRMVHQKTSHYSFIAPVVVGAIIGQGDDALTRALVRFATALGVAFQVQDDLLNLDPRAVNYGKEVAGDLWEGKHTLVLLHALRKASRSERARAVVALRKRRPTSGPTDEGFAALRATVARLRATRKLSAFAGLELERAVARAEHAADCRSADDVAFLLELIRKYRSIEHARNIAHKHALRAQRSLTHADHWLGPSEHRDFLHALVHYVIERDR